MVCSAVRASVLCGKRSVYGAMWVWRLDSGPENSWAQQGSRWSSAIHIKFDFHHASCSTGKWTAVKMEMSIWVSRRRRQSPRWKQECLCRGFEKSFNEDSGVGCDMSPNSAYSGVGVDKNGNVLTQRDVFLTIVFGSSRFLFQQRCEVFKGAVSLHRMSLSSNLPPYHGSIGLMNKKRQKCRLCYCYRVPHH